MLVQFWTFHIVEGENTVKKEIIQYLKDYGVSFGGIANEGF